MKLCPTGIMSVNLEKRSDLWLRLTAGLSWGALMLLVIAFGVTVYTTFFAYPIHDDYMIERRTSPSVVAAGLRMWLTVDGREITVPFQLRSALHRYLGFHGALVVACVGFLLGAYMLWYTVRHSMNGRHKLTKVEEACLWLTSWAVLWLSSVYCIFDVFHWATGTSFVWVSVQLVGVLMFVRVPEVAEKIPGWLGGALAALLTFTSFHVHPAMALLCLVALARTRSRESMHRYRKFMKILLVCTVVFFIVTIFSPGMLKRLLQSSPYETEFIHDAVVGRISVNIENLPSLLKHLVLSLAPAFLLLALLTGMALAVDKDTASRRLRHSWELPVAAMLTLYTLPIFLPNRGRFAAITLLGAWALWVSLPVLLERARILLYGLATLFAAGIMFVCMRDIPHMREIKKFVVERNNCVAQQKEGARVVVPFFSWERVPLLTVAPNENKWWVKWPRPGYVNCMSSGYNLSGVYFVVPDSVDIVAEQVGALVCPPDFRSFLEQ